MQALVWSALGLAAGYAGMVVFLYLAQERLMYHPDPSEPVPEQYGFFDLTTERVRTADGVSLLAWWGAPRNPALPVLVVYHGNAGHLGDRAEKLRYYRARGFGILAITWRYNAGAGGRPGESALMADARAALDFLEARGIVPEQTVLYGESLGTGMAVAMAAERPVAAVILEAPYSSVADVAAARYPIIPVRKLIRAPYDSVARIGRVAAPILIAHGSEDRIIPLRFAQRLATAAPEGTEFQVFDGAGHVDLDQRGLQPMVIDFLRRRAGIEVVAGPSAQLPEPTAE